MQCQGGSDIGCSHETSGDIGHCNHHIFRFKTGKECIANCEATLAVGASRANQLRAMAFLELQQGNLDRYTLLINEAIAVRDQAVAQLRECLRQCPVLYPDFERSIADRVAAFIGW